MIPLWEPTISRETRIKFPPVCPHGCGQTGFLFEEIFMLQSVLPLVFVYKKNDKLLSLSHL